MKGHYITITYLNAEEQKEKLSDEILDAMVEKEVEKKEPNKDKASDMEVDGTTESKTEKSEEKEKETKTESAKPETNGVNGDSKPKENGDAEKDTDKGIRTELEYFCTN